MITAEPSTRPTFVLTDGDGLDDRLELVRHGVGSILPRSQAAAYTIRYIVDVLAARSTPPALTVLLIEQDQASRELIGASIEGHDFSVIPINDLARAWDALVWMRPDIVLFAVAEPERDGFELCRALRADPRYEHLPLIVLIPRCGDEMVAAALLAGASDCLVKPIRGRELFARVHAHAERARMMRELIDRDEVTGLDNRRAAERDIERLARIALRRGEPLTVALLHLEHLGELGEREGQAVADIVLRQFAHFLRNSFRSRGPGRSLGRRGVHRGDVRHRQGNGHQAHHSASERASLDPPHGWAPRGARDLVQHGGGQPSRGRAHARLGTAQRAGSTDPRPKHR